MYDLIVVGGGPAGLSAALRGKHRGLECLVIDRSLIASTINGFPLGRHLFSSSDEVELTNDGLPSDRKPTREEVLTHYSTVVQRERINFREREEVESIKREDDAFIITTKHSRYESRCVLVAVGGFGCQRKLDVPGESPARVSYSFDEASRYAGQTVLVVGGGNSAAEAVLDLLDAGARVTMAVRRPELAGKSSERRSVTACGRSIQALPAAKIKPWVLLPLERAALDGRIRILTSAHVIGIGPDWARLKLERASTEEIEIQCSHIFALLGADPDTRLLESTGVGIAFDGRPVYNEKTFETNIAGLFVAGHLTRKQHMKNAINTGRQVVDYIASHVLQREIAVV